MRMDLYTEATELNSRRVSLHTTGQGVRQKLRSRGLTLAQFGALTYLAGVSETNVGTIAEALGVTRGNLTGVVMRLAADGYVSRTRSATDDRAVIVALTDAGRTLLESLKSTVA